VRSWRCDHASQALRAVDDVLALARADWRSRRRFRVMAGTRASYLLLAGLATRRTRRSWRRAAFDDWDLPVFFVCQDWPAPARSPRRLDRVADLRLIL